MAPVDENAIIDGNMDVIESAPDSDFDFPFSETTTIEFGNVGRYMYLGVSVIVHNYSNFCLLKQTITAF